MADNTQPEQEPTSLELAPTPESPSDFGAEPVIDDALRDQVSQAILAGLQERGLLEGKTPGEVSKIVGMVAAGGAINSLKVLDNVDPTEESQNLAESSIGNMLAKYQELGASVEPEHKEIYSSSVDDKALEKAKLAKDSVHDALTGLLNRRGFDNALHKNMGRVREDSATFFVVDLNGLTRINGEKGHPVGDKVIEAAAQVLTETTREGDIVARTGGDEFWVVIFETEPDKGLIAGKRAEEPSEDVDSQENTDVIKSFSSRAAVKTLEHIDGIGKKLDIDLDELELAIGGAKMDRTKSFEEIYEKADALMYRDKQAKYAAKGKVYMKDKNNRDMTPEEKMNFHKDEISKIDEKLDSGDESDESRRELIYEREAIRLLMAAQALTTLQSEPFPPIEDETLARKYLRPDMRQELDKRISEANTLEASDKSDPQKPQLELIKRIISSDEGTRLATKLYTGGSKEVRPTWIDDKTKVSPRYE